MDGVRRITICYHTRNERAQAFYASEMVAALRVA